MDTVLSTVAVEIYHVMMCLFRDFRRVCSLVVEGHFWTSGQERAIAAIAGFQDSQKKGKKYFYVFSTGISPRTLGGNLSRPQHARRSDLAPLEL
jgi:hypothetical protein